MFNTFIFTLLFLLNGSTFLANYDDLTTIKNRAALKAKTSHGNDSIGFLTQQLSRICDEKKICSMQAKTREEITACSHAQYALCDELLAKLYAHKDVDRPCSSLLDDDEIKLIRKIIGVAAVEIEHAAIKAGGHGYCTSSLCYSAKTLKLSSQELGALSIKDFFAIRDACILKSRQLHLKQYTPLEKAPL